jgi:hypothetical protein
VYNKTLLCQVTVTGSLVQDVPRKLVRVTPSQVVKWEHSGVHTRVL